MLSNRSASAPPEPSVLASAASGVIEMIRTHGGDVERIFGHAHIDTSTLESPINELRLREYCQLFEEAATQTQYDNFGLIFGQGFPPRRLGAIGYLAINSPTMSSALRNLCYYFPAHQQNSILEIRSCGGLLRLDYQIVDPRIPQRRQDAELSLGMFCNIFRHCHGAGWRPREIHFAHPEPLGSAEHAQLFGAPVRFDQPTNSILFGRADKDGVMPDPDPHLFALIEPFMRGRQSEIGRSDDLVAAVRRAVQTAFCDGTPQLATVAARLGMTSWTLQRRLRRRSVGFQDLVRGVRRDLALRYVTDPDMPLTEIAFLLGYSELSAFSRAFRAWTGMAPLRYRRRHARE